MLPAAGWASAVRRRHFLAAGHEVVVAGRAGRCDVISAAATVVPVISTEEMLEACLNEFPNCDGLIGRRRSLRLSPDPRRSSQAGEDRRRAEASPGRNSRCRRPLRSDAEHQDRRFCSPGDSGPAMRTAKLERKSRRPDCAQRPRGDPSQPHRHRDHRPSRRNPGGLVGLERKVAEGIVRVVHQRLICCS